MLVSLRCLHAPYLYSKLRTGSTEESAGLSNLPFSRIGHIFSHFFYSWYLAFAVVMNVRYNKDIFVLDATLLCQCLTVFTSTCCLPPCHANDLNFLTATNSDSTCCPKSKTVPHSFVYVAGIQLTLDCSTGPVTQKSRLLYSSLLQRKHTSDLVCTKQASVASKHGNKAHLKSNYLIRFVYM